MNESAAMKATLLSWLRFGRQMPHVAAEVGAFNADVAGLDGELVEVEVKTSRADLMRDFVSKVRKHQLYASPSGHESLSMWIPRKFYICVPPKLEDDALEAVAAHAPKYGVLRFGELADYNRFSPWKRLVIVRRAVALHDHKPHERLAVQFAARMSSDLAHFYMMRDRYGSLLDDMRQFSKNLVEKAEAPAP